MLDPEKLSEEERALVEEIAKAKGLTPEQVLIDLGHQLPQTAEEDSVVSLEGETAEVVPAAPIAVAVEEPVSSMEVPDPGPEIEPPPPVEENPEPEVVERAAPASEPSTITDVCPHCGIDKTQAVIEEPEHKDKLAFLQAILGGVCYSKRSDLFDGNLRVTFRTLTVKEIDALYEATYAAQQDGKVASAADYYEYLNRLRLNVQLVAVVGKSSALHHKLPDGLSVETNSKADQHWDVFLKSKNKFKDDVPLVQQIQEYVLEHVLATEQLLRVVTHECQKFNRLAAKLEARVDDADFWKETGRPS